MLRRLAWLACLVVGGCGSSPREDLDTLVRVDAEPEGAACAEGGVAIRTGVDLSNDGYLDDVEVTSTQYVCNGLGAVACNGGKILTGTIIVSTAADFDQLAEVNCVDGDLLIAGTDVEQLPVAVANLHIISGDLVIVGNEKLRSPAGMPLAQVGGTIIVQGNESLTDLQGLGDIADASAMSIVGNNMLPSLRGLEGFVNLHTQLLVANNLALTSLDGLQHLVTSSKQLAFRSNPMLANLDALAGVRALASLELSGSGSLTAIELPALQKIDVRSLFNTNAALQTISFPALSSTGDFIQIDNCGALHTVELPSLLTTGGLLVDNDNSLATWSAPKLVYVTGRVNFVGLPALTTLALPSLSSIGLDLVVKLLPALADFTGLPALTTIGGQLVVASCSGLHDFTGLANLFIVSGDMTVTGNATLASFAGLDAFAEVGEDLTINTNPMLPLATSNAFASSVTVHGKTMIAQ